MDSKCLKTQGRSFLGRPQPNRSNLWGCTVAYMVSTTLYKTPSHLLQLEDPIVSPFLSLSVNLDLTKNESITVIPIQKRGHNGHLTTTRRVAWPRTGVPLSVPSPAVAGFRGQWEKKSGRGKWSPNPGDGQKREKKFGRWPNPGPGRQTGCKDPKQMGPS